MVAKRVLCAWEYGAGTGHLYNLAPIVHGLAGCGARVVVATAQPAASGRFFGNRRVKVMPAPQQVASRSCRPAVSHPSLLLNLGFGDAAWLQAHLRAWRRLLDAFRPQLLVCDHADGALIAARSLGIPAVTVGSGFFNPPASAPMPAFDLGLGIPMARVAALEAALLSSLNQALDQLGCASVDQVGAIYRYPARLCTTWPELDHYGARPDVIYCGPTGPTCPLPAPSWPAGGGEPAFVYLTPGLAPEPGFVAQLAAAGYRLLVAAPGMPKATVARLQRPGVRIVRHQVDLGAVARDCRLLFCNANHGTVAKILRTGRLPLIVPQQVEQLFLTRRLQAQGLAVATIAPAASVDYLAMIHRLKANDPGQRQVQRFARSYGTCDEEQTAAVLLTRVLGHLG